MKSKSIIEILNIKAGSKLAFSLLLVAAADFLFYGENTGWTLGLFSAALTAVAALHNCRTISSRWVPLLACMASIITSMALVYAPGRVAIGLAALTLFGFALSIRNPAIEDMLKVLVGSLALPLYGGCRSLYLGGCVLKRKSRLFRGSSSAFKYCVVPGTFLVAFVFLFSEANPVLGLWLSKITWPSLEDIFSPRILFWFGVGALCFPIIRPRLNIAEIWRRSSERHRSSISVYFNESSTIITLVLFNAVFAAQNFMDIAVLWGGAGLPAGVNYADYAHGGAYPLVFTAMLAALFVLLSLKPGTAMERNKSIRTLVYAWVGQNILLTGSAIMRLVGYVAEYSLTYLRVLAFVWMGLVVIGLILIVARIYFDRKNLWLINANCVSLYVVLVLCCFVNFGGLIADYNVRHCREIAGTGSYLDERYLIDSVGADAMPAMVWYAEHTYWAARQNVLNAYRYQFIGLRDANSDWRQWTVKNYLLSRELAAYYCKDDVPCASADNGQ